MKKLVFAFALAGLAASASAQSTGSYDVIPQSKYSVATNSFWSNWFIQVGGDYNATYSSQEADNLAFNPFSKARGNFGASFAIGKWFTPGIGLRTKVQGIWGKKVYDKDTHPSYKYWNLHEDVMFNLSNLLAGYNESRVWNFIPYAGVGLGRNMSDNWYGITYNVGILNTFKVSRNVLINLEIYANAVRGYFDRSPNPFSENGQWYSRHWDKQLGASVGLTFNLGKATWEKTPDVDALIAMNQEQINALNASLKSQQDENARLRELLAKKPAEGQTKVITEKEVVATQVSVFFNLNRTDVASKKDLVNVQQVADYAKANNSKILVTGYADSNTGNAAINKTLSEKRAQTVADILVKMGVNRDNITTEAKGGVDQLSPAPYNRRATVELK